MKLIKEFKLESLGKLREFDIQYSATFINGERNDTVTKVPASENSSEFMVKLNKDLNEIIYDVNLKSESGNLGSSFTTEVVRMLTKRWYYMPQVSDVTETEFVYSDPGRNCKIKVTLVIGELRIKNSIPSDGYSLTKKYLDDKLIYWVLKSGDSNIMGNTGYYTRLDEGYMNLCIELYFKLIKFKESLTEIPVNDIKSRCIKLMDEFDGYNYSELVRVSSHMGSELNDLTKFISALHNAFDDSEIRSFPESEFIHMKKLIDSFQDEYD